MRIAINTRFLLSHKMEGFGWYTYETVSRLVEKHPEHTFILFFDRPYDQKFVFGSNVIPVVLFPPARHPFLFMLFFEVAVSKALKKYEADVFFSPDGYLSLRSAVPQIPVIHDLNFEYYPKDIPWMMSKYLRSFFPKFARKATKIVTVSEHSKADIVKLYGVAPERINVGWNGASEKFAPASPVEKALTRQQHANGKEYFLFVGALHPRKNVGRLLQAFESYVAKGGSHDLVIVGENLWKKKYAYQSLISGKAAERIHFTGHLPIDSLVKVMASALAFVYVPYFEGFGIPLVEAMQCGVPIISGNLTSLPEVAAEAALYVDPFKVEEIADAMHRIETDAELRETLAQKGLKRADLFSWDHTADVVWKTILEVTGKNDRP